MFKNDLPGPDCTSHGEYVSFNSGTCAQEKFSRKGGGDDPKYQICKELTRILNLLDEAAGDSYTYKGLFPFERHAERY